MRTATLAPTSEEAADRGFVRDGGGAMSTDALLDEEAGAVWPNNLEEPMATMPSAKAIWTPAKISSNSTPK